MCLDVFFLHVHSPNHFLGDLFDDRENRFRGALVSWDRDRVDFSHTTGIGVHQNNTVGKLNSLLDIMGDHDDGFGRDLIA